MNKSITITTTDSTTTIETHPADLPDDDIHTLLFYALGIIGDRQLNKLLATMIQDAAENMPGTMPPSFSA